MSAWWVLIEHCTDGIELGYINVIYTLHVATKRHCLFLWLNCRVVPFSWFSLYGHTAHNAVSTETIYIDLTGGAERPSVWSGLVWCVHDLCTVLSGTMDGCRSVMRIRLDSSGCRDTKMLLLAVAGWLLQLRQQQQQQFCYWLLPVRRTVAAREHCIYTVPVPVCLPVLVCLSVSALDIAAWRGWFCMWRQYCCCMMTSLITRALCCARWLEAPAIQPSVRPTARWLMFTAEIYGPTPADVEAAAAAGIEANAANLHE